MNNNVMISVRNLKKYFGNVKAVDDISFEVKDGEIFGLLGPNGAGKTTTIKLLLGLLEANNGTITIMGMDPRTEEVE
ncbi:MAG: ATP-binding cassette domain-containing protein, partial [Candidatus Hermodarchaeota archaeon]